MARWRIEAELPYTHPQSLFIMVKGHVYNSLDYIHRSSERDSVTCE